jgi:hypothetical protein
MINANLGCFTLGEQIRYPWNCGLGGSKGRSGLVRLNFSLPGFDRRTVQITVSRYTDYTIPAQLMRMNMSGFLSFLRIMCTN